MLPHNSSPLCFLTTCQTHSSSRLITVMLPHDSSHSCFLTIHHPCACSPLCLLTPHHPCACSCLITCMPAHAAGKSWQARYGQEPGKQEPTATLSVATSGSQTISMLQASCWPTWPSSPSVNQAALTAHLYRGLSLFPLHAASHRLPCTLVLLYL